MANVRGTPYLPDGFQPARGAERRNVLVRMVHYKAASARKQQRKAKDVAKVGTGSPAK